MKRLIIPLLLTTSTVVTIIVNALANLLPFNNITTAAVSDSYPVSFTPAGYVFSIWGMIYLGLTLFCLYSWIAPANKQFSWPFTRWYVIASVANSLWLVMWHYQQLAFSVVLMLILLISLIRLYTFTARASYSNLLERVAKRSIWSLYLGWISVATIANVTVYVYSLGWQGSPFPDFFWTSALIMVAAALAMVFVKYERNIVYPLVVLWASVGIAIKNSQNGIITLAVIIAIAMIGWEWVKTIRDVRYSKRSA